MSAIITGLHHVTAFAKSPAENVRFYTTTLGLRLVKKTVNFDDPFTYHLYYGDESGSPGTLLTHFPNPRSARATHGGSEITDTSLAVPSGALAFWRDRLKSLGVRTAEEAVLGARLLRFTDHEGMRFAIVEHSGAATGYAAAGVPGDAAITGIAGVTVHVPNADESAAFLRDVMGFADGPRDGEWRRLTINGGGAGREIDLVHSPQLPHHPMGAGTVHHVAWRVPDDAAQKFAQETLRGAGVAVTPVLDRQYFRSIYFRIPGGVIFEIATDIPGFDVDEPRAELGRGLKLPPQYESRRESIASRLEPLA
jgi:glyoxalase family protein